MFKLLTKDPSHVNARQMSYRMTATPSDGKSYRIDGFKTIHDDRHLEIWPDTTTLFTTVIDLNGASGTKSSARASCTSCPPTSSSR